METKKKKSKIPETVNTAVHWEKKKKDSAVSSHRCSVTILGM